MDLSYQGALFIAAREAIVLVAYQDGKHLSIGLGDNDPSLKHGDTITIAQAFERFRRAIPPRVAQVERRLKVPVRQHEFDAIFSGYYQSGTDFLNDVTEAVNLIADDPTEDVLRHEVIARSFLKHNTNAAGTPMSGLFKRRVRELCLFETGEYGDLSKIPLWRGDPRTTKREDYVLQPGDLPDV